MDGQRTDDGQLVCYKLTNEPVVFLYSSPFADRASVKTLHNIVSS